MLYTLYLGLGSNIRPQTQLLSAIQWLTDDPLFSSLSAASLYQSAPLYNTEQPDYLNTVVSVKTTADPLTILKHVKGFEAQQGRNISAPRNSPRPIDIDLIYSSDITINSSTLTLPHPAFMERLFVLMPLAELAPKLLLPHGRTIQEAISKLQAECSQRCFLYPT